MARITYQEALTMIQGFIETAGGELSHNDLLAELEANGQPTAGFHVIQAARRGDIGRAVRSVPGGRPELVYTV
jgi:hypothetical protein